MDHPPTEAQKAAGWSQDWDAWAAASGGAASDGVVEIDFTKVALQQEQQQQQQQQQQLPTLAPPLGLSAPLPGGGRIPLIGLGTWKSRPGEVRAAVFHALVHAGYRHVDAAAIYNNEAEVGDALADAFRAGVRREDVFVTSKLWNSDHAAGDVEAACRKSLRLLKLDYLDAYLIHWPVTGKPGPALDPPLRETWAAMERLVDAGLVRHLGVSNFSPAKMAQVLGFATKPLAICQCERHPQFRNDKVTSFCDAHGIHFTAYSPLGSPDSAGIFKRSAPAVLDLPEVAAAAAATGRDKGQVLIRWALQSRPGSSVLPKSTTAARISGNADVVGWDLPAEHERALGALRLQARSVTGAPFCGPAGPYRTPAELWDEEEDKKGEGGEKGAKEA